MLTLTYEYKLKPTKQQLIEIENQLTTCRQVWNYALRERKDWVNSRKCRVNSCSTSSESIIPADRPFPNYHIQAKALTEAKKTVPELKAAHSQVLQQVLRNLDRAWDNMKARKFGFPRFKNQSRMRSFLFPKLADDAVQGNCIKLPKLGLVKFKISRPIPDGFLVKQARVIRRASSYFVQLSLQLNVDVPDPPFQGYPLGVDIGLESFLATSDGQLVSRPKFFKALHRKLKLLQRRLKFKKLGSHKRKKLNSKIARLHQKISDTRKDFHFKTAHLLCENAGAIFVEDIDFTAWAKGMLGKHTLDAGFGQFFNILSWVCWKTDTYFAKVDKNYTSQICPNCGAHTGKKTLDIRVHSCPECGYTTHRDVAAAQVIRNRGIDEVLSAGAFRHLERAVAVGQTVLEIAQ
jgi:putative transposase